MTFYCAICKTCIHIKNLKFHQKGNQHRRKAFLKDFSACNQLDALEFEENGGHCAICNVDTTGLKTYVIHKSGKKHRRNIRKKYGDRVPSDFVKHCIYCDEFLTSPEAMKIHNDGTTHWRKTGFMFPIKPRLWTLFHRYWGVIGDHLQTEDGPSLRSIFWESEVTKVDE